MTEIRIERGILFLLFVIPLIFLIAGCSTFGPSAEQLKALSDSDRTWCLSVTSVYGTVRIGGTGLQGGTVRCNQEGMQIEAVREVTTEAVTTETVKSKAVVTPKAVTPKPAP